MGIGYVTIGTHDVEGALPFFDAVLGALDWERKPAFPGWEFYGPKSGDACLGLCRPFDGGEARAGNGIMVSLKAASKDQIAAAHAAALAHGGSDEGGPGYRPPEDETGFYAAYFRDPVGNKYSVYLG